MYDYLENELLKADETIEGLNSQLKEAWETIEWLNFHHENSLPVRHIGMVISDCISEPLKTEVLKLICDNKHIEAIKLVRKIKHVSLYEAKKLVDDMKKTSHILSDMEKFEELEDTYKDTVFTYLRNGDRIDGIRAIRVALNLGLPAAIALEEKIRYKFL